jgi:hypothetical protein
MKFVILGVAAVVTFCSHAGDGQKGAVWPEHLLRHQGTGKSI